MKIFRGKKAAKTALLSRHKYSAEGYRFKYRYWYVTTSLQLIGNRCSNSVPILSGSMSGRYYKKNNFHCRIVTVMRALLSCYSWTANYHISIKQIQPFLLMEGHDDYWKNWARKGNTFMFADTAHFGNGEKNVQSKLKVSMLIIIVPVYKVCLTHFSISNRFWGRGVEEKWPFSFNFGGKKRRLIVS